MISYFAGITTAFALLIEPFQFYVFKRLNKFISTNSSFFVTNSYNCIYIYYNNFIFTIFSFITISSIHTIFLDSDLLFVHISYKLRLLFLIFSFLVYKMNCNYKERYYKPNVLEISIAYQFYIISCLFAMSSHNFISLYFSLELHSLSLISLMFVITFVMVQSYRSNSLDPISYSLSIISLNLVEAALKYF